MQHLITTEQLYFSNTIFHPSQNYWFLSTLLLRELLLPDRFISAALEGERTGSCCSVSFCPVLPLMSLNSWTWLRTVHQSSRVQSVYQIRDRIRPLRPGSSAPGKPDTFDRKSSPLLRPGSGGACPT